MPTCSIVSPKLNTQFERRGFHPKHGQRRILLCYFFLPFKKKVGATLTLDRLDLALPSDTAGPKRDGVTNVLSLRPTILLLELNKKRELKILSLFVYILSQQV